MSPSKPKIVVILGPTASGKSDRAIKLARKRNGEIISADSRQVYRGLDIGSGKVTAQEQRMARHHLLDVANVKRMYTVAQFQRDGTRAIRDILKRGKLPIICGGTGFWVETLLTGASLPPVPPNAALRKKLSRYSTDRLFAMLRKQDPARAENIDPRNPVRLIRALEILAATKQPIQKSIHASAPYDAEIIIMNPEKHLLHKRIEKRLRQRLRRGMIAEVQRLRASGVSDKRLLALGLEYRYVTLYLQGKLTRTDMERQLLTAIKQYAQRQMTWIRGMERRMNTYRNLQ